jgi:hypothetical protein
MYACQVSAPILLNVTLVDTPGVLSGRKQREGGRMYDFTGRGGGIYLYIYVCVHIYRYVDRRTICMYTAAFIRVVLVAVR